MNGRHSLPQRSCHRSAIVRRRRLSGDRTSHRVVPAFTTGGGGFAFEDQAGTWVLAAMLSGSAIGRLGCPSALLFQEKVPRTGLDDLVLLARGQSPSRLFVSIKSFDLLRPWLARVRRRGVGAAAWRGVRARPRLRRIHLRPGRPRSVDEPSGAHRDGRAGEQPTADGRAHRPAGQLQRCRPRPVGRARMPGGPRENCRGRPPTSPKLLLSRLIAVHLDFRSSGSRAKAEALAWCEAALASGQPGQGPDLYDAAFRLVASVRPSGGSIDWARVQRDLGLAIRAGAATGRRAGLGRPRRAHH